MGGVTRGAGVVVGVGAGMGSSLVEFSAGGAEGRISDVGIGVDEDDVSTGSGSSVERGREGGAGVGAAP